MTTDDFAIEHLPAQVRALAAAITLKVGHDQGRPPSGGGCKAFKSAAQWADRGEEPVPPGSLVMVHDGGDLSTYFGSDPWPEGRDRLIALIESHGFGFESGASWYSYAYPKD